MDRSGWNIPELRATFEVEVLQSPAAFPPSHLATAGGRPAATVLVNGRPVVPAVPESGGSPQCGTSQCWEKRGERSSSCRSRKATVRRDGCGWPFLRCLRAGSNWRSHQRLPSGGAPELRSDRRPTGNGRHRGANLGPVEEPMDSLAPAGPRAANPGGRSYAW